MKRLIVIGLVGLMVMSCSTMTFIPEEGTAAKFNLATVEYVNARNASMLNDMALQMEAYVDTVLADDRAALDSLTSELTEIITRLDSVESSLTGELAGVSKEMVAIKTAASNTRTVVRRISASVDALPTQTLETLTKAVDAYLKAEAAKEDEE